MADTPGTPDDPTELREDVEKELDDLVEDAAEEERGRMAERDQQGVDEPSEDTERPAEPAEEPDSPV